MADYSTLLSPEIWAFIRASEAAYPADAATAPIEAQRGYYDALCAKFDQPHPKGIRVENFALDELTMRRYHPTSPRGDVFYLHGGGFVVGGLESHDAICAEIAHHAQARVLAVDYRLAPEHRHPAALEDCTRAYHWLSEQSDSPIILVGDSAGATLAAAITHRFRQNARIKGQALIYPWLGDGLDTPSCSIHAHAPMLTTDDMHFYLATIQDPATRSGVDDLFVLNDADVGQLPPTFILTAECDPLASDGHIYAARLVDAAIAVDLYRGTGLVHGFLRARFMAPEAAAAYSKLQSAISAMLD
jgi:acetyl esterase